MPAPVVLVVESSPELRRMFEESLQDRGYIVTSATDAGEALDLLRRRPADLLIADPSSDVGAETRALDDLHREFPGMPSIVVSPDTSALGILTPPREGEAPRRLLRRPFTLRELLTATRRLLPTHDVAPPRI
jgi:CheY-like chemotaxis protein